MSYTISSVMKLKDYLFMEDLWAALAEISCMDYDLDIIISKVEEILNIVIKSRLTFYRLQDKKWKDCSL